MWLLPFDIARINDFILIKKGCLVCPFICTKRSRSTFYFNIFEEKVFKNIIREENISQEGSGMLPKK